MGIERRDFPVGWDRKTGVDDEQAHSFVSSLPFDGARIHAASIYCSDGRVGEQIDEFLHEGLHLPRYDRLAMPGGPACYAGGVWEGHAAERQLDFLFGVHGLERLVLIAHQGCAFYGEWLKVPPDQLEQRQMEDVRKAAARIRQAHPTLAIESYFLRRSESQMWFDPIEAET
jgi:Putative carbonic anhydrase